MQEIVDVLSDGIEENKEIKDTIQKVLKTCFEEEHIEGLNLYITVTLTTPEKIRELNQVYRNIDKETDVLSFPMFEKEEIDPMALENGARNSFLVRLRRELDIERIVCMMEGISMKPFLDAIRQIVKEYEV